MLQLFRKTLPLPAPPYLIVTPLSARLSRPLSRLFKKILPPLHGQCAIALR
ncbi:hypothetical protein [Pseudomonas luteola]|uniref:hypothetical protein n=1 Tax=Pseudomonas luteola TaxID=47886 RepID=UPI0028989921|nr:hypothetical protein [Pseudomonas luteola]